MLTCEDSFFSQGTPSLSEPPCSRLKRAREYRQTDRSCLCSASSRSSSLLLARRLVFSCFSPFPRRTTLLLLLLMMWGVRTHSISPSALAKTALELQVRREIEEHFLFFFFSLSEINHSCLGFEKAGTEKHGGFCPELFFFSLSLSLVPSLNSSYCFVFPSPRL